jgi:hypothetical protein
MHRPAGEWETALVLKGKTNILPVETGKLGLGLIGGAAFDLLTGENVAIFSTVPATRLAVGSRPRSPPFQLGHECRMGAG